MSAAPRDLLAALPHRPPFRFLSRIIEVAPGARGHAVWRVSGDEAFFAGHFPGQPIVPGVLLIEALAQLSGLIALSAADSREASPDGARGDGRLAHADVRFRELIVPPAEIELHAALTRQLGALIQFDVRAGCGETIAASGTLTIATLRA